MIDKLLIATFSIRVKNKRSAINGMVEPLLSYFLPKVKELVLIDGAHPGSDTVLTFYERYKNGTCVKKSISRISTFFSSFLKLQNSNATHLSFKIRDLLSTIEFGIFSKHSYDLFIGLESVHTIAGILLKRIGKVKKVVYYVSDYSPHRYSNKFLNNFYLFLDRFCCYHADYIWDVSPAMMPARLSAGLQKNKSAPVILVPNALSADQISYLPIKKRQPYSLIFVGTLGPENGPQLAIQAMPDILKVFPQAKLHIIGGDGKFETYLRQLVKKLHLESSITFHGFLSNAEEVSRVAKKYMIGIAPYTAELSSPRWYADATKIRLYLGAGLPVVTTQVPPLGKELEKIRAGVVIKDNEQELAKAVVKIFSDPNHYAEMSRHAVEFAKYNTWENIYTSAIKKMKIV